MECRIAGGTRGRSGLFNRYVQHGPAAEPPRVAHRNGALIVQVNPEPTSFDAIAHNLYGPAATIMPDLLAAVCPD
jgi:hypothetical protein